MRNFKINRTSKNMHIFFHRWWGVGREVKNDYYRFVNSCGLFQLPSCNFEKISVFDSFYKLELLIFSGFFLCVWIRKSQNWRYLNCCILNLKLIFQKKKINYNIFMLEFKENLSTRVFNRKFGNKILLVET